MKRELLTLVIIGGLAGCNIRLQSNILLETEDAIYGKTNMNAQKEQSYDPRKKDHLTFFESVAGAINSDAIKSDNITVEQPSSIYVIDEEEPQPIVAPAVPKANRLARGKPRKAKPYTSCPTLP